MPSTEDNKLISTKIEVGLTDTSYSIEVYDNPLAIKWVESLKDNLKQKRVLEKNFCFIGFVNSKRDLHFLCGELNQSIDQINSFNFNPPYEKIHPFRSDDFQYSRNLPVGKGTQQKGLRLKHDSCNLLHRYFEDLQGTAWTLSPYYKQADSETRYAIRQLNNICHEIEGFVNAQRKMVVEPEWVRPAQITTFLKAPRFDLAEDDYKMFLENRYDRELGGVYLHWSQVGKTLYEVYRDEHAPVMTEALCSEINHQKYYSGEFDVEWGKTITDAVHDFKKNEIINFKRWLAENNYDWDDPKLALGYAKIGQVDLMDSFQTDNHEEIYKIMNKNLDIRYIKIISDGKEDVTCDYEYHLESHDWKKIQKESLE